MDLNVQLIVKVQQFEDKRIEAKASWNIKELKGRLSEIYAASSEEQKLIYSGKLLNDTVVLKDVLRQYDGQEAHTVHLVFTPKACSRNSSKSYNSSQQNNRQLSSSTSNQNSSQASEMATSGLRQRHTTITAPAQSTTSSTNQDQQQQPNVMNIPSNYINAFYGTSGTPGDANNILAQQYAMQTWMQQAYTQYMSQYMNLLSSPEAFYNMHQQQQSQQSPNFAFLPSQMPFVPPNTSPTILNDASVPQSPNNEAQAAPVVQQPPAQPAEVQQRRFPNIIQDEQENRDWLDILYSMSRLMILLCLVYFYSSPIRCLVVILIGLSIYLYHIYKQNQNRLNNNNSTRVNLNNVNRPVQQAPEAAEPQNDENREGTENEVAPSLEDGEQRRDESEAELLNPTDVIQESNTPQVSFLTVARTFVLSFLASIIPEAPAL